MLNFFKDISFQNPEWFWLLTLIPLITTWRIFRRLKLHSTFMVSNINHLSVSPIAKLRHLAIVLKTISFILLVIALARPQSSYSWQNSSTEGIDIIVAIDVSGSMLAEDFKPNRLEASKEVAMNFIENRSTDRIGLVVYAGESFTQCPLTSDKDVLLNLFKNISNGIIEDGTAIGLGLANSVNRLKKSKAKSKVVILITDGANTTGSISPATAAEIARAFNIRVYTIGVGSKGVAKIPVTDQFGNKFYQNLPVNIDEETLKNISATTDGKYYRAVNKKALKQIYQEIDKLEKSKIDVTDYRRKKEMFFPFALIACILLLSELILKNTLFKSAL